MGHSCGTLFRDTLVCGTLLWDTLVGHLGHSCGTSLQDTLVGDSPKRAFRTKLFLPECICQVSKTNVSHTLEVCKQAFSTRLIPKVTRQASSLQNEHFARDYFFQNSFVKSPKRAFRTGSLQNKRFVQDLLQESNQVQ